MPDEAPQGQPAPTPAETATETPGAPISGDQTAAAPEPEDDDDAEKATSAENKRAARGVKRRLDELTRNWREAERREQDRARDAEHWRELALRGGLKPGAQDNQPDTGLTPPKEGDFKEYADYLEARGRWAARQEVAQAEQRRMEAQQRTHAERQAETARKRLDEAAERYDDFQDVALRPDVPVTQAMAQAMAESEKIGDIAYYLGKHPEEAQRIAQLSPMAAARELGKIEAKLEIPAPKKTTAAPPPPNMVSSGGNAPVNPEKLNTDDWMRWREGELRKQRT